MTTATAAVLESSVLAVPAADAADAQAYFARKLACETDPADVWDDLQRGVADFLLVDTRSAEAYVAGHLPGAISLPHRQITPATVAALPLGKLLVTYCWSPACNAGTKGARKLAALGLPVKEMVGGYEYWLKEGYHHFQ
jgi:rhodanese-related sulfurtransferase